MNIKKASYTIKVVIRGFKNLGKENLCEDFFNIIDELGSNIRPTKIGINEPLRNPYSLEYVKKMWSESAKLKHGKGIIFKSKSGFGSVSWRGDNSNIISLNIKQNVLLNKKNIDKLIVAVKKIFIWANGVYGYVYHSSMPVYSSGLSYKICLPGIAWLNLFGLPYINLFSSEIIESSPCFVEKFADNYYLLILSEMPEIYSSAEINKQEIVKNHLGKDAFDRKDIKQTYFTFEEIREGKDIPSKEGYRSPDFTEYINISN